jgi:hypothetical protein
LAPGCPKIQENNFSAIILQVHLVAFQVLKCKVLGLDFFIELDQGKGLYKMRLSAGSFFKNIWIEKEK